jgi:LysM repeat protein
VGRSVLIGLGLALASAACGGGSAALPPPPTADVVPTTATPPSTTTTATTATAPTATTAPPVTTTTLPPTTTTTTPTLSYEVVAGDTLVTIAERFGVSADQLSRLNRLSDPRRLQVGQTLTVPVPPDGAAAATG